MKVGAYTKLVRSPGVPRLAAAFLALRIASTTAGGLLFGPARGRLIDRIGPRDAVLRLAIPDIATDIAFIAGGHGHVGHQCASHIERSLTAASETVAAV
ncbi:MAG: hypothetical protein ACXVRK_12845 [Gaiellaceae bacterium]